jgi:regulator of sigma E protease
MTFLIAVLGLALLVLIHEAGHFFAARLVRMNPRRFYIGFPPALVKVRRKGIEYGLGAIPLGGYVKIPGMHRPAPSDVDVHLGRALEEAPELVAPVERVKRMLEQGKLEAARASLPPLEAMLEHVELTPLARRTAERGVQELKDGLGADAYWRAPVWKRIFVIFAGPGMNLLFAIVVFAALFMVGGGEATRTVEAVLPGRPAATAGLQPGDRIIAVDNLSVTPSEISDVIDASRGRPIAIVVERHGNLVRLGPVRPREDAGVYRLGFVLKGRSLSAPEATWRSLQLTGFVTREIGESMGRLVTGEGRKDIASPVGIVRGSSTALKEGGQRYLWVLGLISLSLALLNLLPLLPLDGGHIAFSIIEGVRGRAVGREVYERVSAVGIALVLLLFFVGLSNDVGRLGGE